MDIKTTEHGLALDFTLSLPHGLHARPSARVAQLARQFKSQIQLIGENGEVDAKSMLDILSLAPPSNARLRLQANGPDAEEALTAIYNLLASYNQ